MAPTRTVKPRASTKTRAKVAPKKKRDPKDVLADAANKKSAESLQEFLDEHLGSPPSPKSGDENSSRVWTVYDGAELKNTTTQKQQIWNLFEHNMRDIYKEANDPDLKWGPAKKKNELFNKKSRFILLEKEGTSDSESELEAFCMFRFDSEENDKGINEFIIYIYEIQVAEPLRGSGVCRRIFTALEKLGTAYKVDLIMLTCFRCKIYFSSDPHCYELISNTTQAILKHYQLTGNLGKRTCSVSTVVGH
ncbi:hypothetical protein BDV93DRAFT_517750 [Ceratobasidium sp. AG-I]|nr:hypothetical protein BDV93DRAFT_517750 [Ceratobasidium sp. AG-I]